MAHVERNPRILEEFKRRRSVQWKVTIGVICCGLLIVMGQAQLQRWQMHSQEPLFAALVVSLMAGCMILTFRNWRCPGCDRYLRKHLNPHVCPACGIPLQ